MDLLVLGFNIEWFDPISSITQNLYLKFFVGDNTIEILREKSAFLKRIHYPEISISDLFVGNTLTIHRRLYTIKGYANKFTSDYMQEHEVHYVGVVRAADVGKVGQVINVATKCNLVISRFYTTEVEATLQSEQPGEEYVEIFPGDTFIEFVGITIDKSARGLSFGEFVQQVQRTVGGDIIFSRRSVENIQRTFKSFRAQVVATPCTLCLIKPHIFKGPKLGDLLNYIAESYQIASLFSIHLTIPMAEEFFDAYRGVMSNYSLMIEAVTTGPLLAVCITSKYGATDFGEDIVTSFREFCGPNHPELARILRPKSVRANFGTGLLTNAVHCTDLPDDGEMEARYFFDTLANL